VSDEPTTPEQADEPPGWQVLDADGNVVQSGSVTQLEAATETGEQQEEQ
jgi:hypothetical protein